ncbi:MAG: ATP-binding protein [Aphanizomenon gracile PMC644.10]|nr:ATP-binding protein [Aphanizomenon gracile PMC627.10]MDM3861788.1 ATP-binding protein [Aphanizomenon gracile PMC644.10]
MQEIQEYNTKLSKQRKSTTALIGLLLTAGFIASIPMFSDSIKHEETLYCNIKSKCRGYNVKRGISFLVDRERRNQLFDNNIKIVKILPPEDPTAVNYGLLSSLFLLSAYGASKALTTYQEESVHSQFKLLKIKALEADIIEQSHLDLFGFSKSNQSEITKQVIARQTGETIAALKSEGEIQLDHLNGQLQGQLSLKGHQLQLSELDKETAKNNLETLEVQRKIDKLSKPIQDSKQLPASEELKNSLIDALKQHEGGYLWTIINSLKPLWLIGNQGSGKTYTASAIALTRKYCLDANIYYLIDRHATGVNAEVWQFLKPSNTAEHEDDIVHAMQQSIIFWGNRIKAKADDKKQIIIDEFTNLRGLVGDIADSFFKLSLTDTRKAKCYLLGITHNDTNSSFADGTKDTRKAGMILVQKFSANGETPLARVCVKHGLVDANGNNLEDVEKTLPGWFHPAKIHDHFNGKSINFED